jgi:hypothetical protein
MSNNRSILGVATLVTCFFMTPRATRAVATQFRGFESVGGSWTPVSRKAGSAWAIAMALMGIIHGTLGATHPLEHWTSRVQDRAGSQMFEVAYGGGRWVAVGNGILTSSNAVDWIEIPAQGLELYSVIWNRDHFIASGWNTSGSGMTPIFTSVDGMQWLGPANILHGDTRAAYAAAEGDGTLVLVGAGGLVVRHAGVAWERNRGQNQPTGDLYGVVYGLVRFPTIDQRRFVAVGRGGSVWISGGGGPVAWLPTVSGTDRDLYNVTYSDGKFVVVGDGEILHSTTGLDWTRATTRPDVVLYGVIRWAGHWVAVGEKGVVYYSRDGDHWTRTELGVGSALSGIAYSGHTFVTTSIGAQDPVIGASGGVWQSDPILGFNGPPYRQFEGPFAGKWRVDFPAELGRTYRLEATVDFRNWDLVLELEGSGELYQGVIDVQEMPPGERFYRLQVD